MLAETVERRATTGWGEAAAKAAVFSASRLKGLVVPLALAVVWEAVARTGAIPVYLLPAPSEVFAELAALVENGELWQHVAVTVWRVAVGFAVGAGAATVLGALTGSSRLLRELLDPTLQALKAVPSLAWVPLFILWFGIFETSKVLLIAIGVFFPIYLNLITAILGTDRKLVEVARICGLSRFDLVRRILVPATLPSYLTGLRSGLALGWMFVIAAELMGASQGLGFLMIDGQMTGRPAIIIGALILFALAGKASDALLVAATRRALAWQDGFGETQEVRSA
ncbi:MAG TPA: ABC transporter permease [Kiloniellaceae bacterium]